MDKGGGGPKPADGMTSGLGQGKGENSRGMEGKSTYASTVRSNTPYQRMDLAFVAPKLVEGKPMVELPSAVV
ncbi:hypothetical protein LIER_38944 [Lithospermum erythrorhizon]|uniref:Uncharacterized protein n=1 Tax=Lithospermum erythrorhizon TaxID=34254 RepID=A0AAV3Q8Q4_LITER